MITFIAACMPNPRMEKRVEIAKQIDDVSFIVVKRKNVNLSKANQPGVAYYTYECDMPSSKHIFRRLISNLLFSRYVSKKLKVLSPNLIYLFGIDSAYNAIKYHNKYKAKIVYEVADIREPFLESKKSLLSSFFLKIENSFLKKVSMLVVTSDKFYESFYQKRIQREKVLFAPNVPNINLYSGYHKTEHKIFTVGVVGIFRYKKQIKMLVDAAKNLPIKLLFAGGGVNEQYDQELRDYCRDNDNIVFTGPFDYKKDITSIYESIDCIYAVYDSSNPNVKIALPNKLYEAAYCEIPIIVSNGTYLGEIVTKYGVGVSVSNSDTEGLQQELIRLSTDREYYQTFVSNCILHKNEIIPADALSDLKNRILQLF